jgi:BirA family transcriptional regulator, biotin operon repressor / biotin---[acetyl-CoA-carboxylase] ligase
MWNIIQYNTLDSTNTFAWEQLAQGQLKHGDVIQAEHQTGGRGRFNNRSWNDEPGRSLLMSIVITEIDRQCLPLLSFLTGMAGLRAIRRLASGSDGDRAKLKWPNDLLIDRKKVAGILVENCWTGSELRGSVIGIGINVSQSSLPKELAHRATSLKLAFGKSVSIAALRDALLGEMKTLLTLDRPTLVKQIRRELDWMTELPGITIDMLEGQYLPNAKVKGISDDGALLAEHKNKIHTIYAATLTLPPA